MHRSVTVAVLGVLLSAAPSTVCAQPNPPRAPLSVFDYDADAPLDIQVHDSIERWQYQFYDLSYASPAGRRVPAFLFVPAGDGPFPGLIIMHGMPGSRQNSKAFAEQYAWTGAVVLAISAPWSRPDDVPRRPTIIPPPTNRRSGAARSSLGAEGENCHPPARP